MKCIQLLLIAFVLIGSVVECREQIHEYEIIVNAINSFRDNLMCLNPVIGLEYISTGERHTSVFYFDWRITPKTCDYTKDDKFDFTTNVQNFINKCVKEAYQGNNLNVSWMWDPKIKNIDCKFTTNHETFVICTFFDVDEKPNIDIKFEKQNKMFIEARSKNDLYTNLCNGTKLRNHHLFRSCFLRQQSRDLIIHELNTIRNELAYARNYTNLQYVKWDFDLEIAAIELSQFDLSETRVGECFTTSKFGRASAVWYYENHTMTMTTDSSYKYLIPNLFKSIMPNVLAEIEYPSSSVAYRSYRWMYDAKLSEIGCTFFKLSHVVHVLCLFNRDPDGKNNLQNGGRFCSECECGNIRYPFLCTNIRNQNVLQICSYSRDLL